MTPSDRSRKLRDLATRAGWTALQAALGLVTAEALDIPVAWAAIVATLLSAAKSYVAGQVGDKTTVTFS